MPKPDPTPLVEPVRPFSHALDQIEGGVLSADLAEQLVDLNASLSEYAASHGKAKGSLSLSLSLHLEKGILEIKADVKVKKPRFEREKSVFWLTPGNQLSAENPKQLRLGLRAAEPESAPRDLGEQPAAARKV